MFKRVYAKINLDALINNVKNIRTCIKRDTKLLAVIKADAYGHGALKFAEILENEDVDYFGVAIIEEAIELRRNGIKKPILILGYTDESEYIDIIYDNITPTMFEYDKVKSLSDMAVILGKIVKIHIKLDTGMSRIGFLPTDESIEEIIKISKLPNINIEGIFTHFACADMLDKTSANNQLKVFNDFVDKLEQKGVYIPIKHLSNSAGIMEMPEAEYNMVRSGIITYGLYPSDEVLKDNLKLEPVMELKSTVIYIKELEKGVGIGYGSTFVTNRKTKVATIPFGYADGMPRSISNIGKVIINGEYAPIIGRICMDQFMVDVTDIKNVKEKDEVTIVGRDGDKFISVEEISKMAHSFNYEFICDISKRVPRIYYKDGKIVGEFNYFELY